jgi:hypothetical protein
MGSIWLLTVKNEAMLERQRIQRIVTDSSLAFFMFIIDHYNGVRYYSPQRTACSAKRTVKVS